MSKKDAPRIIERRKRGACSRNTDWNNVGLGPWGLLQKIARFVSYLWIVPNPGGFAPMIRPRPILLNFVPTVSTKQYEQFYVTSQAPVMLSISQATTGSPGPS